MPSARKSHTTTPRRLPRSAFGAASVDAILVAVENILEIDGPDRLTTNRVADLAGVSIGSLYQYFPNKQSLVGALQDKYDEDTLSRVRTALEGAEAMPIESVIGRIAMAIVAAKHAQRPIHRWLIEWRSAGNSAVRYRRRIDDQVELIAEFLARHPDVVLEDVDAAAFVIVNSVDGLITGVTERADVDPLRIARSAVAMVTGFVTHR